MRLLKRGYILGVRGKFWERRIHNLFEKGGVFWEGGVDSGTRRHLNKSRKGG